MTIEHFSPLKKSLQRLGSWVVRQASRDHGAGHDVGLPRLQPRGRAPAAGRLQVHLHARDDHPGGQDDRRDRPRPDPDERQDARVAAVPVDVDRTSAATAVSIFRIYSMYEPLRVFMTLALIVGARRARRVGALLRRLGAGRRRRPRAVADPRRGAVQRRRRAGRARHHRRPAERPADHAAARSSSACGASSCSSGCRRRTTSPAPRRPASRATTGARRRPRARPKSERPASCEPTVTRDAEGTVTGNTYDKYGSTNPVVKKLMAGFERTLDELWAKASPRSVLDVGCGEGVLTHKWAQRLRDGRVVGIDLEDPAIQAEWAKRQAPEPRVPDHEGREPARSPTASSSSRPRSRCSSTCPTPSTRSPRWRAWRAAGTCSCRSRASRCGAA